VRPAYYRIFWFPFAYFKGDVFHMTWYGYGSISINSIFKWMNVHLKLFWCSPGVQGFDPLSYRIIWVFCNDDITINGMLLEPIKIGWLHQYDLILGCVAQKVWSQMRVSPTKMENRSYTTKVQTLQQVIKNQKMQGPDRIEASRCFSPQCRCNVMVIGGRRN
jgi:hypothetical protein